MQKQVKGNSRLAATAWAATSGILAGGGLSSWAASMPAVGPEEPG